MPQTPRASITWMLNSHGEHTTSDVIIEASGSELLIGLKALITKAAKVLSSTLMVPQEMARQAILDSIN